MRNFFKRFFHFSLIFALLAGQGCTNAPSAAALQSAKPSTIDIWGVIDDGDVYAPVIADYRKLHPNLTINYRRLRLEEYESQLVNAIAEDRGPDIFLIHNDWTNKYLPKILPMPASTKVAYRVVTGTVQKTETWELRTEPSLAPIAYKNQYADVIAKDLLRRVNVGTSEKANFQEKILGVPISVDTMALYYNKDLLNAAGIPNPPETWGQFQEQTKKLVKRDGQGNILQAAAGIGTGANVERATDILTVLMQQNGAVMAAPDGTPTFDRTPAGLDREVPPGQQALEFYTDFANPNKETYTWNATLPNALDMFVQGRSAFFFGYSFNLAQIRAQAPKLNLGITKLPQIEGNPVVNQANYWYWTVSKRTKNPEYAWNFLNYLAKSDHTKTVLDLSKHPAALKSLLAAQLADEDIGVFAAQVLTATSWYQGVNPKAMEAAFLELINTVVTGATMTNQALRFAADKVAQTYSQ